MSLLVNITAVDTMFLLFRPIFFFLGGGVGVGCGIIIRFIRFRLPSLMRGNIRQSLSTFVFSCLMLPASVLVPGFVGIFTAYQLL